MTPNFGSLNDALANANPFENFRRSIESDPEFRAAYPDVVSAAKPSGVVNLMRSAGPVSDAYMLAHDPVMVISGPQGSGKTIASQKKVLIEGQRIRPGPDRVRRYVLGVFRQKYDSLWKATIPSWWKLFPKDLVGSTWTGASPRAAQHRIKFEDAWGLVDIVVHFLAFGEAADTEDLRGLEFTDVLLPEIDTLPEELLIYLIGRIGREPPKEITGREGRIYGDMNAPDVLNWTYKKLYRVPPLDGYVLYRQPSGMAADAENLQSHGGDHSYYENQMRLNAENPWWIRRMVHGIPGMSRATNLVYDKFDELTMVSKSTLKPDPYLPMLVGIDGGLTPAAVYAQEFPDGQLRIYAEIALDRGGIEELATAMLALEARRFRDCEFVDRCDPSMLAGEDRDTDDEREQRVSKGSDRQRLRAALERPVEPAVTNEPTRRWDAVRVKTRLTLGPARPGLLLDPACLGLLRGFLQTYHFRVLRGSNDLSSVQATFDTHVHDALQCAALECGSDVARKRRTEIDRLINARRDKAREGVRRYNPFARRA